jgi:hypothetical protein
MTDTTRPNPFSKFSLSDDENKTSSVAGERTSVVTPVQATTSTSSPIVDAPATVFADSDQPKTNPFSKFDASHDDGGEDGTEDGSLSQAMGIGAVIGGYKGARNSLNDRQNIDLVKGRASQGYLNGMLPPDIKLTLKSLQDLTGMPVRTQSEIQAALVKLHATPANREARIVETPSGRKIRSGYTTTPATEQVDLSKFQVPSRGKAISTGGASGLFAGALAAPALYQAASQEGPLDWTQGSAIAGALPTIAPKLANYVPGLKQVAPFLGVPYAIRHKEELLNSMRMNDINPTAFPAGTLGSEESPMQEPARSAPSQTPPLSFPEKLKEEGRRAFPNQSKSTTLLDYLMMPAYSGAVAGRRD